MAQLEALQIKRTTARTKAFEDARDLCMLNIMEGNPIDPADLSLTPGFVFSIEEIRRHVNLEERRGRARHFRIFSWDAKKTYPKPHLVMPAAA